MPSATQRKPGLVYTFYSYKGGVGRSMALANVAALLAKWGRSVLIVDWDLEASGIETFFEGVTPGLRDLRRSKPGIVDLIIARSEGHEIDWSDCLIDAYPFGATNPVSIITAGRSGEGFTERMQSLDFGRLFAESDLGSYIEKLRNEWISKFDTVLIDSRTGITDIGGICTIHLPDVLVLLFTTTETSVRGVIDVITAAREQQAKLPFERRKLLALPVPARDESRTEFQKAEEWKRAFADRFSEYYRDWLPAERTPLDVLNLLRIPYVPFWSFGETLPVVVQGTSDPSSLGAAYEVLARLIETDLEWHKVLSGEVIAAPVRSIERTLDEAWVRRHRARAFEGLSKSGRQGFMEVVFYSPNAVIIQPQDALLYAARNAAIHTLGWPIGIVLEKEDKRPRPTTEGIVAEIEATRGGERSYDYWALTKQGDFYSLIDLLEDRMGENSIFFNTRIVRTTETLLYCSRLVRGLGANGNTRVILAVRHGGLKGRVLSDRYSEPAFSTEDEITSVVSFLLSDLDRDLVDLVEKLCEPLFLIFDFQRFGRHVYQKIVTDFVNGRVS
jgi:MinD-like ATPase involved in chromosome partitioning or flagellar assembly